MLFQKHERFPRRLITGRLRERSRRLATSLNEYAEVLIFLDPIGPKSDAQFAGLPARCICPPSVADLTAAMSLLDLVVSADSAPIHLAAALGLPVVAMFENRPEKYLRWYPLGVPSVLLHEGRRVDDIPLESVHEAALAMLLNEASVDK